MLCVEQRGTMEVLSAAPSSSLWVPNGEIDATQSSLLSMCLSYLLSLLPYAVPHSVAAIG